MNDNVYDVAILGAGPAGLAAGLYAGRAGLRAVILEKGPDGGQIINTSEVENYPGQLVEGETGESLAARMTRQAEKFGCLRARENIKAVYLDGDVKVLEGRRNKYMARTVIIATGAGPRPIGCAGESDFVGRGVSYCATCDGSFFKGLRVIVAGGGDSAVEEACYLTKFARQVTIVHRRDTLRAAKAIQDRAFANPAIDFLWDSVIEGVEGDALMNAVTVKNVKTGALTRVEKQPDDKMLGLFVFVGNLPATSLFEGVIDMESGYIRTDESMMTSLPGVFAAGDVRVKPLRQVITAAADGAVAAVQALKYIEEHAPHKM